MTEHDRTRLAWGLNLDVPEVTTQEEIDEFRRTAIAFYGGAQQDGLEFWLEQAPEVLKRYRAWADTLVRTDDSSEPLNKWSPAPIGTMYMNAITGFDHGVEYILHNMSRTMSQAQILEILALVFRYVGPRGMATIARVASTHEWKVPESSPTWPKGWAPDPDAFASGADFTTRTASAQDVERILEWYERWLGEIPRHVRFLARHRPDLLKAYRARYENALRVIPKQAEPSGLVQISMYRNSGDGIREGMLLGRGFGITRSQILATISWGTFFGGQQVLGLVDEVAGDVLDSWPD